MNDLKKTISKINNGVIDKIYFLKGEDQFLQNFFIDKLFSNIFSDTQGFKKFFTTNEFSGKEIIDSILSIDLFISKKLFVIKEPQKIKGKPLDELLKYCNDPSDNHFLVLINDNFADFDSFSKKMPKNILKLNVSTPFNSELLKWAKFFIKENGKTISTELLNEIVENCGDSLYNIKNEIDKICLMTVEEEIKKDYINSETTFLRGRKRWELMNSIGIRDLEKSIKLAKSIINSSESMVSMIFPLMTFFQEILFFKMNDGTFIKPNSYIPLSPSIQNNLGDFSRYYRRDEIELAIRKLKEIEIKQKTSNIDDETEFINFLYNAIG